MTQEAYCSYEVSRLLKEKGFNERTLYNYIENQPILQHNIAYNKFCNSDMTNAYSAPTHQMAMKWLREEKGIYISMRLNAFAESKDELGGYWWFADILDANKGEWIDNGINKVGYEKAVEAALKYTLENLI